MTFKLVCVISMLEWTEWTHIKWSQKSEEAEKTLAKKKT